MKRPNAVPCPICGARTRAIKPYSDGAKVYRKRRCEKCKYTIFTTEAESVESEEIFRQFDSIAERERNKRNYQRRKKLC